jgi:hypothetical protein
MRETLRVDLVWDPFLARLEKAFNDGYSTDDEEEGEKEEQQGDFDERGGGPVQVERSS